jgi:hypothetical protein
VEAEFAATGAAWDPPQADTKSASSVSGGIMLWMDLVTGYGDTRSEGLLWGENLTDSGCCFGFLIVIVIVILIDWRENDYDYDYD